MKTRIDIACELEALAAEMRRQSERMGWTDEDHAEFMTLWQEMIHHAPDDVLRAMIDLDQRVKERTTA
jgi:hypothetical protein